MWNRKQEIELWNTIYFSMERNERTISLFHSNLIKEYLHGSCNRGKFLDWIGFVDWVYGLEEKHGGFEHMAVVSRSLLSWLEDQEWIIESVMVKLQLFSRLKKSLTPFLEYESMAGIAQACLGPGSWAQVGGKGSSPSPSNSRSCLVVG